jgi:hypothetical protein
MNPLKSVVSERVVAEIIEVPMKVDTVAQNVATAQQAQGNPQKNEGAVVSGAEQGG